MRALPLSCTILLLAAACNSASTEDALSDRAAADVVGDWLNQTAFGVPIGNLEVVRPGTNAAQRQVSAETYRWLGAWKNAGVVEVQQSKDLGRQFTGWDDWIKLSAEGVQLEIRVQPTSRGRELTSKLDENWLFIPKGRFEVGEIVRNEPMKKGIQSLRLVMCFLRVQQAPEVEKVLREMGQPVESEQKFQGLFHFDAFKKAWVPIVGERVERDAEFVERAVEKALENL